MRSPTERDLSAYAVPYYVERYSRIRHHADELFQSERALLHDALAPATRVLDIGCAAGGFYNILRTLQPEVDYLGVDISDVLIREARRRYPGGRFEVSDGLALPYEDGAFDLVQAWGVCLHEPHYRDLLSEMWRLASRACLFDVRLQIGHREILDRSRSYVLNPGGVRNFYIVQEAGALLGFLLHLRPAPGRIALHGYAGRANQQATLPDHIDELFMVGAGLYRERSVGDALVVEAAVPPRLRDALAAVVPQGTALVDRGDGGVDLPGRD